MRKVIQVDVVQLRVFGMPRQLCIANRHLVTVVWNDCELVRKVLLLYRGLNSAVRESIGGDWFQDQPALDESISCRRSLGRRRRGQSDRSGLRERNARNR